MSNTNYFSLYFVDYEFNLLKISKIKNAEENPQKIFNFFKLKKKTIPPKDIKLIEELILSLNEENQFLYADDYYTPNLLIKCILKNIFNKSNQYKKTIIFFKTSKYKKEN